MDGYDAVILVDAMARGEAPGTVFLVEPDTGEIERLAAGIPDAHSMNPMTALQLVRTLGGEARNLYVVGCEPGVLESEEIGLSDPVRGAVPGAVELIEGLIHELMEKEPARPAFESNQT